MPDLNELFRQNPRLGARQLYQEILADERVQKTDFGFGVPNERIQNLDSQGARFLTEANDFLRNSYKDPFKVINSVTSDKAIVSRLKDILEIDETLTRQDGQFKRMFVESVIDTVLDRSNQDVEWINRVEDLFTSRKPIEYVTDMSRLAGGFMSDISAMQAISILKNGSPDNLKVALDKINSSSLAAQLINKVEESRTTGTTPHILLNRGEQKVRSDGSIDLSRDLTNAFLSRVLPDADNTDVHRSSIIKNNFGVFFGSSGFLTEDTGTFDKQGKFKSARNVIDFSISLSRYDVQNKYMSTDVFDKILSETDDFFDWLTWGSTQNVMPPKTQRGQFVTQAPEAWLRMFGEMQSLVRSGTASGTETTIIANTLSPKGAEWKRQRKVIEDYTKAGGKVLMLLDSITKDNQPGTEKIRDINDADLFVRLGITDADFDNIKFASSFNRKVAAKGMFIEYASGKVKAMVTRSNLTQQGKLSLNHMTKKQMRDFYQNGQPLDQMDFESIYRKESAFVISSDEYSPIKDQVKQFKETYGLTQDLYFYNPRGVLGVATQLGQTAGFALANVSVLNGRGNRNITDAATSVLAEASSYLKNTSMQVRTTDIGFNVVVRGKETGSNLLELRVATDRGRLHLTDFNRFVSKGLVMKPQSTEDPLAPKYDGVRTATPEEVLASSLAALDEYYEFAKRTVARDEVAKNLGRTLGRPATQAELDVEVTRFVKTKRGQTVMNESVGAFFRGLAGRFEAPRTGRAIYGESVQSQALFFEEAVDNPFGFALRPAQHMDAKTGALHSNMMYFQRTQDFFGRSKVLDATTHDYAYNIAKGYTEDLFRHIDILSVDDSDPNKPQYMMWLPVSKIMQQSQRLKSLQSATVYGMEGGRFGTLRKKSFRDDSGIFAEGHRFNVLFRLGGTNMTDTALLNEAAFAGTKLTKPFEKTVMIDSSVSGIPLIRGGMEFKPGEEIVLFRGKQQIGQALHDVKVTLPNPLEEYLKLGDSFVIKEVGFYNTPGEKHFRMEIKGEVKAIVDSGMKMTGIKATLGLGASEHFQGVYDEIFGSGSKYTPEQQYAFREILGIRSAEDIHVIAPTGVVKTADNLLDFGGRLLREGRLSDLLGRRSDADLLKDIKVLDVDSNSEGPWKGTLDPALKDTVKRLIDLAQRNAPGSAGEIRRIIETVAAGSQSRGDTFYRIGNAQFREGAFLAMHLYQRLFTDGKGLHSSQILSGSYTETDIALALANTGYLGTNWKGLTKEERNAELSRGAYVLQNGILMGMDVTGALSAGVKPTSTVSSINVMRYYGLYHDKAIFKELAKDPMTVKARQNLTDAFTTLLYKRGKNEHIIMPGYMPSAAFLAEPGLRQEFTDAALSQRDFYKQLVGALETGGNLDHILAENVAKLRIAQEEIAQNRPEAVARIAEKGGLVTSASGSRVVTEDFLHIMKRIGMGTTHWVVPMIGYKDTPIGYRAVAAEMGLLTLPDPDTLLALFPSADGEVSQVVRDIHTLGNLYAQNKDILKRVLEAPRTGNFAGLGIDEGTRADLDKIEQLAIGLNQQLSDLFISSGTQYLTGGFKVPGRSVTVTQLSGIEPGTMVFGKERYEELVKTTVNAIQEASRERAKLDGTKYRTEFSASLGLGDEITELKRMAKRAASADKYLQSTAGTLAKQFTLHDNLQIMLDEQIHRHMRGLFDTLDFRYNQETSAFAEIKNRLVNVTKELPESRKILGKLYNLPINETTVGQGIVDNWISDTHQILRDVFQEHKGIVEELNVTKSDRRRARAERDGFTLIRGKVNTLQDRIEDKLQQNHGLGKKDYRAVTDANLDTVLTELLNTKLDVTNIRGMEEKLVGLVKKVATERRFGAERGDNVDKFLRNFRTEKTLENIQTIFAEEKSLQGIVNRSVETIERLVYTSADYMVASSLRAGAPIGGAHHITQAIPMTTEEYVAYATTAKNKGGLGFAREAVQFSAKEMSYGVFESSLAMIFNLGDWDGDLKSVWAFAGLAKAAADKAALDQPGGRKSRLDPKAVQGRLDTLNSEILNHTSTRSVLKFVADWSGNKTFLEEFDTYRSQEESIKANAVLSEAGRVEQLEQLRFSKNALIAQATTQVMQASGLFKQLHKHSKSFDESMKAVLTEKFGGQSLGALSGADRSHVLELATAKLSAKGLEEDFKKFYETQATPIVQDESKLKFIAEAVAFSSSEVIGKAFNTTYNAEFGLSSLEVLNPMLKMNQEHADRAQNLIKVLNQLPRDQIKPKGVNAANIEAKMGQYQILGRPSGALFAFEENMAVKAIATLNAFMSGQDTDFFGRSIVGSVGDKIRATKMSTTATLHGDWQLERDAHHVVNNVSRDVARYMLDMVGDTLAGQVNMADQFFNNLDSIKELEIAKGVSLGDAFGSDAEKAKKAQAVIKTIFDDKDGGSKQYNDLLDHLHTKLRKEMAESFSTNVGSAGNVEDLNMNIFKDLRRSSMEMQGYVKSIKTFGAAHTGIMHEYDFVNRLNAFNALSSRTGQFESSTMFLDMLHDVAFGGAESKEERLTVAGKIDETGQVRSLLEDIYSKTGIAPGEDGSRKLTLDDFSKMAPEFFLDEVVKNTDGKLDEFKQKNPGLTGEKLENIVNTFRNRNETFATVAGSLRQNEVKQVYGLAESMERLGQTIETSTKAAKLWGGVSGALGGAGAVLVDKLMGKDETDVSQMATATLAGAAMSGHLTGAAMARRAEGKDAVVFATGMGASLAVDAFIGRKVSTAAGRLGQGLVSALVGGVAGAALHSMLSGPEVRSRRGGESGAFDIFEAIGSVLDFADDEAGGHAADSLDILDEDGEPLPFMDDTDYMEEIMDYEDAA